MRKFSAVIFDMDGVLVEARDWHYQALNEALVPFGMEIPRAEHESRFNGMTTKSKLEILSQEQGLPRELHPMIQRVKQDRTLRLAAANCYPVVQHLILISRLRLIGTKVGVYTNSIRQTSEYMLRHSQVLPMLDSLVTNEDVEKPKPHPEGYLLSCSKLEVTPETTLVIEDGDYGIASARAAGCEVIQVSSPLDVSIELLCSAVKGLI